MSIFTQDQIASNTLYSSIMQDINDLYVECGQPVEIQEGQPANTTTGNGQSAYWDAGNLGDWEGKEEDTADYANACLDEVYHGLNLYCNGGVSHYYTTTEWDEFVSNAQEIINDYHSDGAYEQLCNIEL